MKKILLVSMPFAGLERPAIGISTLQAILEDRGFECDIKYLLFQFARFIGVDNYNWICNELPHTSFSGEWVFADSLYNERPEINANYIQSVLVNQWKLDYTSLRKIQHVKSFVPSFMDYCLDSINWSEYSIIGFTSTFEQNISSLSLAKRLKQKFPNLTIIFGGANWESEMGIELHNRFSFVDYAIAGEADKSFLSLVQEINSGNRPDELGNIPGLIYRTNGSSKYKANPLPVKDINELPVPEYKDYFTQLDSTTIGDDIVPSILFESSRGCWWGDKHHCRFCGLNGESMAFRSKQPGRIIQEIKYLSEKWKSDNLQAVDNVIDTNYLKTVFPVLSSQGNSYSFFYEIRASLKRDDVKILSEAGVNYVQPGIESLNDHILKLMNKGTNTLQNIQLLKWCKEFGIIPGWNLLYGFPFEEIEDYVQMLNVLQKIRYLDPPTACGPVRLDRFSPYYINSEKYKISNITPLKPYYYLYPFNEVTLQKIAYYFDYKLPVNSTLSQLWSQLISYVDNWKKNPEQGSLCYLKVPNGTIVLTDTRSTAITRQHHLSILESSIYKCCDHYKSLNRIVDYITEEFPSKQISKEEIKTILNRLENQHLMLKIGDNYLSLAISQTKTEETNMPFTMNNYQEQIVNFV